MVLHELSTGLGLRDVRWLPEKVQLTFQSLGQDYRYVVQSKPGHHFLTVPGLQGVLDSHELLVAFSTPEKSQEQYYGRREGIIAEKNVVWGICGERQRWVVCACMSTCPRHLTTRLVSEPRNSKLNARSYHQT